jgi:hypothetical protein
LPGIGVVDNAVTLDPMYLPFPKMAEFASLVSGMLAHPGPVEIALEEGVLKLAGTLPNDGLKAGLVDLAAQLGVDRVEDQVEVKVPDTFLRVSELRVTRNRFGITLSGVFPEGIDRTDLVTALREAGPAGGVVDRIESDPTCAAAPWQGRLAQLLPALLRGLRGEMTAEFNATRIRVTGGAVDAAAHVISVGRPELIGKCEIMHAAVHGRRDGQLAQLDDRRVERVQRGRVLVDAPHGRLERGARVLAQRRLMRDAIRWPSACNQVAIRVSSAA